MFIERNGHANHKMDRNLVVLDWHSFNLFQHLPTQHIPQFDW